MNTSSSEDYYSARKVYWVPTTLAESRLGDTTALLRCYCPELYESNTREPDNGQQFGTVGHRD